MQDLPAGSGGSVDPSAFSCGHFGSGRIPSAPACFVLLSRLSSVVSTKERACNRKRISPFLGSYTFTIHKCMYLYLYLYMYTCADGLAAARRLVGQRGWPAAGLGSAVPVAGRRSAACGGGRAVGRPAAMWRPEAASSQTSGRCNAPTSLCGWCRVRMTGTHVLSLPIRFLVHTINHQDEPNTTQLKTNEKQNTKNIHGHLASIIVVNTSDMYSSFL